MKPMKYLRAVVMGCWLVAICDAAVFAQEPPVVDTSKIGPKVGAVAPEFSGTDQNGIVRSLKTAAGPNGSMLVFFRSADW